MSYMHRPLGGPSTSAGAVPAIPAGAGPAERAERAPGQPAGVMVQDQRAGMAPAAAAGGPGRLSDLLDFVKAEFEHVQASNEALRRENLELIQHADAHVQEVLAIRRELAELDREQMRSKQRYEEQLGQLKREIEHLRAANGSGPAVPSVLPATTNHFGTLMGHPHGMFGQGNPAAQGEPLAGNGNPPQPHPLQTQQVGGAGSVPPVLSAHPHGGPSPYSGHPSGAGARPPSPPHSNNGYRGDRHDNRDLRRQDDRMAVDERDRPERHLSEQHLGKRARGEDGGPYDGIPPIKGGRPPHGALGPLSHENGIESRTAGSAAFPPRPPSRTYAASPHPHPPGHSAPSLHAPVPQGPPEPSVLTQPSQALSKPTGDAKPVINAPPAASGAPPYPLQRPPPHAQSVPPPANPNPNAVMQKKPDWDVEYNKSAPKVLDVSLVNSFMHDSVVCCVRISPDGKLLATGCNRLTTLFDTTTGETVGVLKDVNAMRADNYIRSVAFSPDGQFVVTGSEDKIIRLYNTKTQALIKTFVGHTSEIYSLVFTSDGKRIVSGSGDRSARVWDLETGATLHELVISPAEQNNPSQTDGGITSVAITPDNKILAAGSLDHVVRLWDMTTGKLLDRLVGHGNSVYSVVFLPGGTQLVTGSLDKTLRVWDLQPMRTALSEGRPWPIENKIECVSTLTGHKDFVLSVTTSLDGRWLVSGSKDRAVHVWDLTTGQTQFTLYGHKNSVISIALSDTGGLLATGSGDWQARLFRVAGIEKPASLPPSEAKPAVPVSAANVPAALVTRPAQASPIPTTPAAAAAPAGSTEADKAAKPAGQTPPQATPASATTTSAAETQASKRPSTPAGPASATASAGTPVAAAGTPAAASDSGVANAPAPQ